MKQRFHIVFGCITAVLFILASEQAHAQGVLNRRTLGNLNVPQLQRGSITPLGSSLEQSQLNLSREQQLQLSLLNSERFQDAKSRLPEAISKDSLGLKDYVKRSIFRDTLIFGSELFREGTLDFAPNIQLANAPNYIVGVGDKLSLTIYGLQEAAYDLEVAPNGTIVVPYAGVISVSGTTLKSVEARLRQKLISAGFKALSGGQTQISIALAEVRSIRVSVLGARKPGSYVMPSVATVFHALYQSGGPGELGSYRNIELVRNGEVIQTIDLYRFIATGDVSDNAILQEGDVIRIPVYQNRVNLMGEFKRPGLFEVREGESLEDIKAYAGDFSEGAYRGQVLIFSTGATELHIADVYADEFSAINLTSGDVILALPLRNRYDNRIALTGGVVRPGYYGWMEGMTFQDVLLRAQGLDREALSTKALMIRRPYKAQGSYMEFNPSSDNFALEVNDSIYVAMQSDLWPYDSISVRGMVNMPGRWVYYPGITAEQAILLAGGIQSTANSRLIEVARPVVDENGDFTGNQEIVLYQPNFDGEGLLLLPGSTVSVRQRVNMETSKVVYFMGAVRQKGGYALMTEGESLEGVFQRVGGLSEGAMPKFGLVVRLNPEKALQTTELFTRTLQKGLTPDSMAYAEEYFDPVKIHPKDTISIDFTNQAQLKRFGVQDGDTIYIPRELNVVYVRGVVKNKGGHTFVPGRRAKYYLNQAGGLASGGRIRDIVVEYANGRSAPIKRFLGVVPIYPRVYSNTTLKVLVREKKSRGMDAGQIAAISSSIASISSITLGIILLLRP